MKKMIKLVVMVLSVLFSQYSSANLKGFMLGTAGVSACDLRAKVIELALQDAKIIRFPIYLGEFSEQDTIESWYERIDTVLNEAQKYGMVVVLDLHSRFFAPPPQLSCSAGDDTANQKREEIWMKLSERYKSRKKSLIWYDLANEPGLILNGTLDAATKKVWPTKLKECSDQWHSVARNIALAIRATGDVHPIVYEPVGSDTTAPLKNAMPLEGVSDQIVSVHFWNWQHDIQHCTLAGGNQFHVGYPSVKPKRDYDALVKHFQLMDDFRTKYKVKVYIGEVGIQENHPNAAAFLRDFTSLADQYNIHTTVHAYKESICWDYMQNKDAWDVLKKWL